MNNNDDDEDDSTIRGAENLKFKFLFFLGGESYEIRIFFSFGLRTLQYCQDDVGNDHTHTLLPEYDVSRFKAKIILNGFLNLVASELLARLLLI